jgi:ATP-dependent DNA helicase RecQ
LSTFGLLRDASQPEVRAYIEQLTADGLLRQTDEPYPVLALTESGVALLKDAAARPDLSLARQRHLPKDKRPDRSRPAGESWKDVDHDLFDRLRAVRLKIARARGVPPYVIFHDTTLRELARIKPATIEAFQQVYGIGVKKASQLGEAFLEEIRRL